MLGGASQAIEPQTTSETHRRQVAIGDKGHPGTQQQREHTGVGAVVHAAGVGGGVIEHHHGEGRYRGKAQNHAARVGFAHMHGYHGKQQWRPNQVELFLDGKRPKVRERRGVAQSIEVRDVLGNLPPVVEEQQRRQDVGAHLGEHHVVEDGAQSTGHHHDGHHGGDQATDAADPEALEVDAVGLSDFVEQQARDQIARKHKEDRDAEQAALSPREVKVIEHHRDDGERTQAVECRDVAGLGASRRLLRGGSVGAARVVGRSAMGARGASRLVGTAFALHAFVRRRLVARAASTARARLRELFHKTSSNDENNQHVFIVAACSCECLLLAQPQARVHIKVN